MRYTPGARTLWTVSAWGSTTSRHALPAAAWATSGAQGGGSVWSVANDGKGIRQITAGDGDGRRFLGGGKPGTGVIPMTLATDGRFIYFSWAERVGDIWIMDVVGER